MRRLADRPGAVITICVGASALVILDLAKVQVAIPHVQSGLGAGPIDVQLIVGGCTVLAGAVISMLGLGGLAMAPILLGGAYAAIVISLAVAGFGGGMLGSASLTVSLSEVPHERGGGAAAMQQMLQRVGMSIGIAVSDMLAQRTTARRDRTVVAPAEEE